MTGIAPVVAVQRRILLVEDEALIAMDLKQRLERLGFSVSGIARTADDALQRAVSDAPDLILMDIHLSGEKDGVDAAHEIRKAIDIPVIYLTAHSDSLTLERAKSTGPFGYVTKPFETDDLRVQIEMAIFKHRTEQKLRQSEARLATTLRNIGDAVIATDSRGRIEFMNPMAEELTGWSAKAAMGKLASEVFDVLDVRTSEPVADPVPAVFGPEEIPTRSGEYSLRGRSGSTALVHMVVSANQGDDGRPLGSVIVFRDITEQRELERRAQESRNMETIAVMAGGLAHDFNNLLTVILGYAELAQADPRRTTDALSQIRRAGGAAAVVCRQLLTVSRNDNVEVEIFDLNEPIVASAKMLRQILGSGCSLAAKLCSERLPIASNRTQIQQILINLATNARDAMPQGGTFTITTRRSSSGMAEMEVRDAGIGMTEETRRKIFEPFFSRKGRMGAGLGMTMVHSLVTKWSGAIEVKSEPGRGTEFRISFPLSKMQAEAMPAEALRGARGSQPEASGHAAAGNNILLVEDDAAIRAFLREQLDSAGFRVFEASSGEAALALAELNGQAVDLLITDVMMPSMTGPDLAKQWVGRWPDTRVLFISGYTEEELRDNELLKSGHSEFVAKPVKPSQLIARVRKMLSRKQSRG